MSATSFGGWRPAERRAEVPQLPKNMMRRKGRPGYWYQKRIGTKKVCRFLGTEYNEALTRLKQLQGSKVSLIELTVSAAVKRWLASYIETSRNEKGRVLAKVRAEAHLVPGLGHYRLSRLTP